MYDSRTDIKTSLLPVNEVRSFLDVCWKVKTTTELMLTSPKGMKPRRVHVIDVIWHINESNGQDTGTARVGDISAFLGVTMPSIIKLVGKMIGLGLVVKYADAADRHTVTLMLTEHSLDIRRIYAEGYHTHLSQLLGGLISDQCGIAVHILTEALRLMQEDFQRHSQNI